MIIDRALLKEITWPFAAVTGGLLFIFASYTITRYLGEAVGGELAISLMLTMIGLRVLIALEVLLPLGLYLGVIIGLGRLYGDQEMTAWQAGGLTRARMLRPILCFAVVVAVLVAAISLYGRPWAYSKIYTLEATAGSKLDLAAITPRRFYSDEDDTAVIYTEHKSDDGTRLEGVFASFKDHNQPVVIRAAALTRTESANGRPTLHFHDGHLYRLDSQGGDDQVLAFKNLRWHLDATDKSVGYKTKAATSATLLAQHDGKDIAERQWRISRPFATVFLALLAIVLARSAPRRSRAGNAFAAAVAFALYYNIAYLARSWVEHGSVPAFPGIYWVDALVGITTLILLFRPGTAHY